MPNAPTPYTRAADPRRAELDALLAGHVGVDADEADALTQMRALADTPGDVFTRDRFDPGHFTAAAYVLSPAGDAALLILHRRAQQWFQPGGHIDPTDATLLAAAAREAVEETGVALANDGPRPGVLLDVDAHDAPHKPTESPHRHYDLRFAFRAATRAIAAGSDAADARWVPLPELGRPGPYAGHGRAGKKLLALAERPSGV